MRKKILKFMMFAAISVVASYNVYSSKLQVNSFFNTTLGDVEALAACEVSSDPSKNVGICVSDIDGMREYCAKKDNIWGNGPACSGTI